MHFLKIKNNYFKIIYLIITDIGHNTTKSISKENLVKGKKKKIILNMHISLSFSLSPSLILSSKNTNPLYILDCEENTLWTETPYIRRISNNL